MAELRIKTEIENEFQVRLKAGKHILPGGVEVDLVNMSAKQIRAIAVKFPQYFIPKKKPAPTVKK